MTSHDVGADTFCAQVDAIFRSSTTLERNVYAVYALGAVGRKQLDKTVLCTVRRSEPASKQRHRVMTQWAFPFPTYEASEDLQLT